MRRFSSSKEAKQYLFETYYSFNGKTGENLQKLPGEIAGQEFQLADCSGCTVELLDVLDRVIMDRLVNCKVFVGPTSGTVIARNCTDCEFVCAANEFRISDSSKCIVRVLTPSPVILEDSSNIVVGVFNGAYSGLCKQLDDADIDVDSIPFNPQVSDFSERNESLPRPHFTIERNIGDLWSVDIPNANGPPEFPLDLGNINPAEPVLSSNPPPSLRDLIDQTTTAQPQATSAVPPVAPPMDDDSFLFPEQNESGASPTPKADDEDDPFGWSSAQPIETEETYESMNYDIGNTSQQTTTTTEFSSMEEDRRQTFQVEFEKRVKAIDAANAAKKSEMREKAEEDLDEHYTQRTNENAIRFTSNREAEKELIASMESTVSDWEKIVSLVDISSSGSDDANEKARMRSLLIQMKNQ